MFEIQIFQSLENLNLLVWSYWFCFNFAKINFVKNSIVRLSCLNMKITHRAFSKKNIIMRSKKKWKTECLNIVTWKFCPCLIKTSNFSWLFFALWTFLRKTNKRRWLQAKDAEHVRSSLCWTDFCWHEGTVKKTDLSQSKKIFNKRIWSV